MSELVELADWTPDVEILGNVGIRRIKFTGHQTLPGHEHNFPHATAVVKGKVRVYFLQTEKSQKAASGGYSLRPGKYAHLPPGQVLSVEEHEAPSKFEVPANIGHMIEAVTEEAECWCIFGVRDETGEIAEMVTAQHKKDRFWHERKGSGDGKG